MYFDNIVDFCKNAADEHYFTDEMPRHPSFIHFEEFSGKVVEYGDADMYDYSIYDSSKNKQILESSFIHDKDTVTLRVNKFKSKNTDYYVTGPMSGRVEHTRISPSDIYFDRDELESFKLSSADNEPANPSSKSQNISKQTLRENAFKYWLIVTANLSGTDKDTLKEAYQLIGKPTQDTIWDALNKMDSDLFNKNKIDFFRHLSLLRVDAGTGKSRRSINRQL